jgi:tRNA (adenine57-N1/adenine58-N1)-methyltransferase catalytic subunit
MYETLLRPHEVNQAPRLTQIDTVAEKLKQLERNREAKRQRQIAASRARRNATEKRKREEDEEADDNNAGGGGGGVDVDPSVRELEAKKAKMVAAQSDDDTPVLDVVMNVVDEETLEDQQLHAATATATAALPAPVPSMQVLSRHSKEVRGHTSFLTFACLLPITRPQTATS